MREDLACEGGPGLPGRERLNSRTARFSHGLIGSSGAGKSTFVQRHFKPTEVTSPDTCRGLVDDDENSLDATADAFALVQTVAEIRLRRRKLAVIDATNMRKEDRSGSGCRRP